MSHEKRIATLERENVDLKAELAALRLLLPETNRHCRGVKSGKFKSRILCPAWCCQMMNSATSCATSLFSATRRCVRAVARKRNSPPNSEQRCGLSSITGAVPSRIATTASGGGSILRAIGSRSTVVEIAWSGAMLLLQPSLRPATFHTQIPASLASRLACSTLGVASKRLRDGTPFSRRAGCLSRCRRRILNRCSLR